jgi:hypothetical protein
MFDPSHDSYDALVECVRCGDAEQFIDILDNGTKIENWSHGSFQFEDGYLYFGTEQVNDVITNRIIEMIKQGFDTGPVLNFLERLYNNSSFNSVNQLYNFMSHKHLPITPEGKVVAYKAVKTYHGEPIKDQHGRELVNGDLVDKFTGCSFRNNVGDENSMPRFKVSDDANIACHVGLHCGALDYAKSYGGCGDTIVIVEFDPADAVSVPNDSSYMKLRTCKYKVVGIFEHAFEKQVVDIEDCNYDEGDYDCDDDDWY